MRFIWPLYFIFIFSFPKNLSGQEIENLKLIDATDLYADTFVGCDIFDAIYFTKKNIFYKKTKNSIFEYSNITLGKIHSVDLINPSQIVVFYKEFNTVIILDNQLNEIDRVSLVLMNPSHIGHATANKLWLFNLDSMSLLLFNYKTNQVEIQSTILIKNPPTMMYSDYNHVSLLNKDGLYCFNLFLNLDTIINTTSKAEHVLCIQKNQYLSSINKFLFLNTEEETIAMDFYIDTLQQTVWTKNLLYTYDGTELKKYQLQKK